MLSRAQCENYHQNNPKSGKLFELLIKKTEAQDSQFTLVDFLIISQAHQSWGNNQIWASWWREFSELVYFKAAIMIDAETKIPTLISQIISKEGSGTTFRSCGTAEDTSWKPKNSWSCSKPDQGIPSRHLTSVDCHECTAAWVMQNCHTVRKQRVLEFRNMDH